MKKMYKREFLRLFKKYAKIIDKSEVIPLKRIKKNLKSSSVFCPFACGYFYEVLEDGNVSVVFIDNPLSDKKFWEASSYFHSNYGSKLKKEMLDEVKTIKEK